jgi:hypothetical protein
MDCGTYPVAIHVADDVDVDAKEEIIEHGWR